MRFACIGGPAGTRGMCGGYGSGGWVGYQDLNAWHSAVSAIVRKLDRSRITGHGHGGDYLYRYDGRDFAWWNMLGQNGGVDMSIVRRGALPGHAGYGAMITDAPHEGWVLQSFTGSQVFPTMEAAEAASDAVLDELIASGKVVTDAFQVAQLNILQVAGGFAVQIEYWVAPEYAEKKKRIWPWLVGGGVVLAGTIGGIAWWATRGKRRRRARRR